MLDPLWGRITHISVDPRLWPTLPRKILVNDHVVKVGWFTSERDPHRILLLSYTAGRWDLLVIPPETDARSAARLMAVTSTDTGPPTTATTPVTADAAGFPRSRTTWWETSIRPGTAAHTVPLTVTLVT